MTASFTAEELTIRFHLDRSRVMIEAMTKQLADLHKDVTTANDALNSLRWLRTNGLGRVADVDTDAGCQCIGCVEDRRIGGPVA